MIHLTIPSPTQGVWQLGPIPIRAYALCILAGIMVAIWLGNRRWVARGGARGTVVDIAAWAVPFGIVGGRLYHVATSYQPYFGPDGKPLDVLLIWRGGLGIWGAIAFGGVGAWIGARHAGIRLPPLADALAPGIVIAQAIGRWGNWFNNELYGGATNLPWGLRIHQWDTAAGRAVTGPDDKPLVLGTFQPAFLYESLWNLGTATVLILLDRRYRIGHGRLFAGYVALYTAGRFWIEALRTDPATLVLGQRINLWVSVVVFLAAVAYIVISARRRPGRETVVYRGLGGHSGGGEGRGAGGATSEGPGDGAGAGIAGKSPAARAGMPATEPGQDTSGRH